MEPNSVPDVGLRHSRSRLVNAVLLLVIASTLSCSDHGEAASVEANFAAPILLFSGTGTSPGDVAALETILQNAHLDYSVVSSSSLNKMSQARLLRHRLLVIPGGNFIDIGKGLTPATTTNVRNAVHNGLNYLGICAGAFLAGDMVYNSFNLTSGVRFGFYSAENDGIR